MLGKEGNNTSYDVLDAAPEDMEAPGYFQLGEPEFKNADSEVFPTHELIFFANENLHLWLDNNKISEIQFGPFWEDMKTIVWVE